MRGHSFRMPASFQSRLKLTHLLHCTSHTDRSDRNSIWFWFSNIDCVRTGGDVDQQEVRTNRTTTTRLNLAIEKKGNSHTFGQIAFLIDGYECILRCRWRWKKISKTVSGISSNFLEYHLIWHTENEFRGWQFCEISPSKTSSNFAQLMILILWCASTIAGFYKELVTQLPSSFFCFFTWQRCRFNLSFTNWFRRKIASNSVSLITACPLTKLYRDSNFRRRWRTAGILLYGFPFPILWETLDEVGITFASSNHGILHDLS